MTREWKPGDVAMVRSKNYPDDIADEPRILGRMRRRWHGSRGYLEDADAIPLYRLAVIDPSSREQVERFHALYAKACVDYGHLHPTRDLDPLTAALREFANPTPPKPDEPQGLGAVVEDSIGQKWVRLDLRQHDACAWAKTPTEDDGVETYEWDEFTAVKVLNEGVQ